MREDTGCFQHVRNLMILVIVLLGFGLGFGMDTAHARQVGSVSLADVRAICDVFFAGI